MGNYQEVLKKQPAALRELENTPTRQHMFGNPFKVNKQVGFYSIFINISILKMFILNFDTHSSLALLRKNICIYIVSSTFDLEHDIIILFFSYSQLTVDEAEEAIVIGSSSKKRSASESPPNSPSRKRKPGFSNKIFNIYHLENKSCLTGLNGLDLFGGHA